MKIVIQFSEIYGETVDRKTADELGIEIAQLVFKKLRNPVTITVTEEV
jgi:hypothetical protein